MSSKRQYADQVMMIRPFAFGFNQQTARDNFYQTQLDGLSPEQASQQAIAEFDQMVAELRQHDVDVLVIEDTPAPVTTDAVFPNNWISLHRSGQVVLYPMCAPTRRSERRADVLDVLRKQGSLIEQVIDFSDHENRDCFLEGTGAIVFDHQHQLAYMARSPRAEPELLYDLCRQLDYEPIVFSALQTVGQQRLPIYHSNVMMSVAEQYAVICADAIDDANERNLVIEKLQQSGKQVIEISERQTQQFAGNVLQVGDRNQQPVLVMSSSAYAAFTDSQREQLLQFNPIVHSPIPTIEALGGGSARCMLAEVFLPQT